MSQYTEFFWNEAPWWSTGEGFCFSILTYFDNYCCVTHKNKKPCQRLVSCSLLSEIFTKKSSQIHFSIIKNNKPCFLNICLPCCNFKKISNTFCFFPTMFIFKHWHFSLEPNSCRYFWYCLFMMTLKVFYHVSGVKPSYASTHQNTNPVHITLCFCSK